MNNRKWKYARALCASVVVCVVALPLFATDINQPAEAVRLLQAAGAGDVDTVRLLVNHGVDINIGVNGDGTALIVAARRGDLTMVNALIRMGADVNEAVPGDGNPLIAAAAQGNFGVVARLIAAGARVNTVIPEDETPLINAVRYNHLEIVKFLVIHGADVNLGAIANGSEWRTPLNQARNAAIRAYLESMGAIPQDGAVPRANPRPVGTL